MTQKKRLSEQERSSLVKRYLAGESHSALSRSTGMSRFVIRRELGPPLRTRQEAGRVPWPNAPASRIAALEARVRELETGLAWYAGEENYEQDRDYWLASNGLDEESGLMDSSVQSDKGNRARAVLAGEA